MVTRIIFEKGIEICLSKDHDLWVIQSTPREKQLIINLHEVMKEYDVRPVLKTVVNKFNEHSLLLSIKDNSKDLDQELFEIEQHDSKPLVDNLDKIPNGNLILFNLWSHNYVLGSVHYHCKRLAESYSEICHEYDYTLASIPNNSNSGMSIFQGRPKPYYEFESLVTSVRRAYNTARYVIWSLLGYKNSMPKSFELTIKSCDRLPQELRERLNQSWDQYGKKVTGYRDKIAHNFPVSDRKPYFRMFRLANDVWSMSCWIPDDLNVESPEKYTYENKIDALTYGWELTNEITEISRIIINSLISLKKGSEWTSSL